MTKSKTNIRIDLTQKTLAEAVEILNAVLSARHILESQGFKVFIRKKKKPSTSQ